MCLSNKIKKDPHIQEASASGSSYLFFLLVIVDIWPKRPVPQPTKHLPIYTYVLNPQFPSSPPTTKILTENPAEAPAPAHLRAGGARSTGPVAGVGAEGAAGVVLKEGEGARPICNLNYDRASNNTVWRNWLSAFCLLPFAFGSLPLVRACIRAVVHLVRPY